MPLYWSNASSIFAFGYDLKVHQIHSPYSPRYSNVAPVMEVAVRFDNPF